MARLITLTGGPGPANDGERRVVAALVETLPADYALIANVEVPEPGGQLLEYDVIVVAPHAVYAVEVKDWWGSIRGDEREWEVNGRTRKSPLLSIERKAKPLKSKLIEYRQALGRVRVHGVVVLSSQPENLDLVPSVARRTFLLRDLVGFLVDPGAVNERAGSISDLASLVLEGLGARIQPRRRQLTFGSYAVTEVLEQSETEAVYRARHRFMPAAPLVRLRVVTLSPYLLAPEQRQIRRQQLYREFEALLRMGSHPNVVAARDVFEDEERTVVVIDDIDARSLRQRLLDGTPLTVQQRIRLLTEICTGLAHAHSRGVVHRQVMPQNVLIDEHGVARLTGFGLSKLLVTDAGTVWDEAADEGLDLRYTAPELQDPALGGPTGATDLFSLGCVAHELFSGAPPFSQPSDAFTKPVSQPQGMPPALAELNAKLLQGSPALRPRDTKDVLAVLEELAGGEQSRGGGPKTVYEAGDLIDGKFEVRAPLGHGGYSNVYRVYRGLDDAEYALKVFNARDSYEKVQREVTVLREIKHPHVVRVIWADRTQAGQWYLVTELVQGESLEDYTAGRKQLSVYEAVEVALDLLSALEAMHPDDARIQELEQVAELTPEEFSELQDLKHKGIVHRDIKPQNLMLTARGVVLIDFNIASRVGDQVVTLSGTPRYRAPDIELARWDVSTDLFAVGVVIYELVCADHPYEKGEPRADRLPRDPRSLRADLSPEFAEFLIKATGPRRAERFDSAKHMRAALASIDQFVRLPPPADQATLPPRLRELLIAAPPNVNPMVREFLALASQARRSNRGTRGLDELSEATYVSTRLDDELVQAVIDGRHQLVVVTGNAGDGKTAFIQRAESWIRQRGAKVLETLPNGSTLAYAGRVIQTLYDGSQDQDALSSDEVLRSFLGDAGQGRRTDGRVRVAAINEGRLRDFVSGNRDELPLLLTLLEQLDDPSTVPPDADFIVVNLNLRSVTAGEERSIFSRQMTRIVNGPFWEPCQKCDFRVRCPIKHNVDTLRDPVSGAVVIERFRRLVDLIRLRRRRHITMRDLRSLASFVLFRDRTCEEIPLILNSHDPVDILDLTYSQAIAGRGAPSSSLVDRGAQLLADVDVALVANPGDDHELAADRMPRRMSFELRESDYPVELARALRTSAGQGAEAQVVLARIAHEASRRIVYFERSDDQWWSMLPYGRLRDLEAALRLDGDAARQSLQHEILATLSIAEGMQPGAGAPGLWLAMNPADTSSLRSFRRFDETEFEMRVVQPSAPYVESSPDHLELVHLPSAVRLVLDLDLLQMIERLREGYVPSIEEDRGLVINLRLFKNGLLARPHDELLLRMEDEAFRVTANRGGTIELQPINNPT